MPSKSRCKQKSHTKWLIAAVLAVFCMLQAGGQQEINFTALTAKDGLSSNNVNAILKDRYGIMWFATEDGLNKFDGTGFTVYRSKPGDSSSLQANEILSLHEDKKGNLWIGTSGGSLSLYDRRQDCFINFPSGNRPNAISNYVIRSICSDYRGNIWIANFNGVDVLEPASRHITRLTMPDGKLFSKVCIFIFEDSQQRIWIGTTEGVFCYNIHTGSLHQYQHTGNVNSLSGNVVSSIVQDKRGQIWIGSRDGLSMLNKDAVDFTNYYHSDNNPASLSTNAVTSLACDDAGKLWIGTDRGLDIMGPTTGSISRHPYNIRDIHGLTSQLIRCVYIDKEGIYWLGTTRGGINKYDRNLNLFNWVMGSPFDEQGLPSSVVTAFAQADQQQLFVGTESGGLCMFDPLTRLFRPLPLHSRLPNTAPRPNVLCLEKTGPNELMIGSFADGLFILNTSNGRYQQLVKGPASGDLNSNDINCIEVDSRGNRWLGTNGEGINLLSSSNKLICRYTPNPVQSNDILLPLNGYIRDLMEDRFGMVWIATHGGGMARFNPASREFTIYTVSSSKLPNDKVQAILEDSRGDIWAGTFGGGLGRFNRQTNQFTTYGEKDGLQNNTIYEILEDKRGFLWVSSNKGLSSIDPATSKVTNYNYYNGIQQNSFKRGAGMMASDGSLFFGGLDGFNYFNPAYLKKNNNTPSVMLADLKISNQSVRPSANGPLKENISVAKEINLDYKQNFALHFVALNYTVPGQNQYAYILEGFEKDWNYAGSTSTASYTNIDPGNYVFRVKASNNDGVMSKGDTSIHIIVHPPIWRTVYAYVLYALLLIGTGIYIRHKGIEKIKRRFKLEQERREAERIHELDQQKIKFLTNLSHEFRTPISLILGPVDKLLSQEKNSWQTDHLQVIKRNGKRLLNLVNQLLDFRKMEEHELMLQPSAGELISFMKDVFDSFKDLAERKKIAFAFSSSVEKLYTSFDHDKLERILFNLLSNAFKFTLSGGTISLAVEQQHHKTTNTGAVWLSFILTDTGIGIPPEKKDKIFDRFFQHTTTSTILNQGSGIGLSITKEFVTLHCGTIAVETAPGKGTQFTVSLPFMPLETVNTAARQPILPAEESIQYPPAEQELTNGHSKNHKPLVLLVEDNEDFRFYLRDSLQANYKILEAGNGMEGWQAALARHPQLIVSDISMPVMDGIELCRKLKADKRTNHIPVILLTALIGDEAQIKGLGTGANDYITKPFNAEVLNAKIKNLLVLKDIFKTTFTRQIDIAAPQVQAQSDDEKLMSNAMRYLDEHITDSQVSVETLSRHLGMSRSTLYSRLFDLTGQTPVEFIRSVKLERAAALMEKTDMNIAQIAYSVGFATPKYFAKSFREKFNVLPSEYLNNIRNNTSKKTVDQGPDV
jgi:signal transduction histidine kinase/ligand-binding sensor domain-containing protein/DNA-binding response OmpR family regulator